MAESDKKPAEDGTAAKKRIGPTSLDEFVGQSELVQRVGRMIAACRTKGSVFPHALLVGPPGIGRTSLAHIIARELGVSLHTANAEDVERAPDLAAIVNNLVEGDVLLLEDFEPPPTCCPAPRIRDARF